MAWVKVAAEGEIAPGESKAVLAGGKDLALFNVSGELHCIENECPHHSAPLAGGDLEDDVVICPWHAWEISVRTGKVLHSASACVPTYLCKIEAGEVLVEV